MFPACVVMIGRSVTQRDYLPTKSEPYVTKYESEWELC